MWEKNPLYFLRLQNCLSLRQFLGLIYTVGFSQIFGQARPGWPATFMRFFSGDGYMIVVTGHPQSPLEGGARVKQNNTYTYQTEEIRNKGLSLNYMPASNKGLVLFAVKLTKDPGYDLRNLSSHRLLSASSFCTKKPPNSPNFCSECTLHCTNRLPHILTRSSEMNQGYKSFSQPSRYVWAV